MQIKIKDLGLEIDLYALTDVDEVKEELYEFLVEESEGEETEEEIEEKIEKQYLKTDGFDVIGENWFEEFVIEEDNLNEKDISLVVEHQTLIEEVQDKKQEDNIKAIMEVCGYDLGSAVDALNNGADVLDFSKYDYPEEELGRWAVEQGFFEVSDNLTPYIDYEKLGNDLAIDYYSEGGIFVRI